MFNFMLMSRKYVTYICNQIIVFCVMFLWNIFCVSRFGSNMFNILNLIFTHIVLKCGLLSVWLCFVMKYFSVCHVLLHNILCDFLYVWCLCFFFKMWHVGMLRWIVISACYAFIIDQLPGMQATNLFEYGSHKIGLLLAKPPVWTYCVCF